MDCIESFAGDDASITSYPGSPLITRKLLRSQDRMAAYELHPEDFITLKEQFVGDYQARVTALDGWMALTGHVPPKEKRGAVLIDPPFEATTEFETAASKLLEAYKKWPGGTYAFWYPAKTRRSVETFVQTFNSAKIPDVLRLEMAIADQKPDGPMVATGMVIINPPYTLEDEAQILLPWLTTCLSTDANVQKNKSSSARHLIEVVSQG